MIANIIQLSTEPINKEDFISESFISNQLFSYDGEALNPHVQEVISLHDFKDELESFLTRIEDEAGVEVNKNENSFVSTKEASEKWFEEKFHKFKSLTDKITKEEFSTFKGLLPLHQIQVQIDNEFGDRVYIDGQIRTLDDFFRYTVEDQKYYIGGIVGYRF